MKRPSITNISVSQLFLCKAAFMKPYARFIIGESFADIIFFGFAFRIISAMSVF
jgi:hypothetical protein